MSKKIRIKRGICFTLALVMVFSVMSINVFAFQTKYVSVTRIIEDYEVLELADGLVRGLYGNYQDYKYDGYIGRIYVTDAVIIRQEPCYEFSPDSGYPTVYKFTVELTYSGNVYKP